MRLITCEDCGKRYDFDREDFCPRCGAFNHPANLWRVDQAGNVVRADGINEVNHAGSFSHKEVHAEKAQRRRVGLDQPAASRRTPPPPPRQAAPQPRPAPRSGSSPQRGKQQGSAQGKGWVFWLVGFIVLVNFILPVLFAFFESLFG